MHGKPSDGMPVVERPFFNVQVFAAPLDELVARLCAVPLRGKVARTTPFVFPTQPYHQAPEDPPMLLWTPSCVPGLTAFMPNVGSGCYFIAAYAAERLRIATLQLRSTVSDAEWPINELIAHEGGVERRMVRAMRDSPRWDFCAVGDPLAIETPSMYSARRIRDRFHRVALLDAAERWGAPLRDPAFWRTDRTAMTFSSDGILRHELARIE